MRDINEMHFKELYLEKSNIHGIGLFTEKAIEKGELVLSFGGYLEISSKRENMIRSTAICLNENIILGERGEEGKDLSDYLNHSCEPNCGMLDSIHIIAIERIEKDQELTINYCFFEGRKEWKLKNQCNCGSEFCLGDINISNYNLLKENNIYFNYFSPFIKRKVLITKGDKNEEI